MTSLDDPTPFSVIWKRSRKGLEWQLHQYSQVTALFHKSHRSAALMKELLDSAGVGCCRRHCRASQDREAQTHLRVTVSKVQKGTF